MSLLVVGSLALDTIETPKRRQENVLGGSGTYFSTAASVLTRVRMVGVIGKDFPEEHIDYYRTRNIDLTGLERSSGKTFRWHGRYAGDLSEATTVSVELNVLADFCPEIPATYADSRFVFLANGHPVTQRKVLEQLKGPDFILLDTMNFWIETARRDLLDLLPLVDGLIVNHHEAMLLSGRSQILPAATDILKLGPRMVVVKKGEHGALLITRDSYFALPAYPVMEVLDTTGAGDSFAGGFMGYLASRTNGRAPAAGTGRDGHRRSVRGSETSDTDLRHALLHGTILASFNVEGFGLERLKSVTQREVEERKEGFVRMIIP